MKRLVWASILLVGLVPSTWADSPYKRTLSVKKNNFSDDGVFIGGKAGSGISLLNVRRFYSPKKHLERVVIEVGDKDANPHLKELGYFQVSLDKQHKRIVVDLAQLKLSRVSERAVQRLFKKSPIVSEVNLTLDPEDKAATLVLNLKHPVRMEVFQKTKANEPGRIVIDYMLAKNAEVGVKR